MFPVLPDDLSALSDDELSALLDEFVAAFNEATADDAKLTDEVVSQLSSVTDNVELLRLEQNARAEAANTRADQLDQLAARVNAGPTADDPATDEPQGDPAPDEPAAEPGADEPSPDEPQEQPASEPEKPVAVAASAKPRGAGLAGLRASAPARSRPRPEDPRGAGSIVAAIEAPGMRAGAEIRDMRQVAELMSERHRTLGQGNGDRAQVVRFNRNIPNERQLRRGDDVLAKLSQFGRTPDSIRAAGGLCAPVNNYYDQEVIADSGRPVRDALANFGADRGGLRFNPPPTLADITSGVGIVTASQDASGSTKSAFSVTCAEADEVTVAAIYNQLKFGNFGARAWPEAVEAWTKLALAVQARLAEQFLLDGIADASTTVSTAGLVGAGRELLARLGQAAAGFRSRNRTQDIPLTLLLPAWVADFIQADFARTFSSSAELLALSDAEISTLFGVRDLSVSWYLDSKTGGGQVFGPAAGGQVFSDAATTSGDTTLTSATAGFTSADVGATVTGAGIAADTTIDSVTSGTEVELSDDATATGTGVTITVGRTTLAQFPTTVYAYMFPAGTFLHLDAGTLDLGLVRDSTLNETNEFTVFSENFENVAKVGPESLEVVLSLNADGTYGAATQIDLPINS